MYIFKKNCYLEFCIEAFMKKHLIVVKGVSHG